MMVGPNARNARSLAQCTMRSGAADFSSPTRTGSQRGLPHSAVIRIGRFPHIASAPDTGRDSDLRLKERLLQHAPLV